MNKISIIIPVFNGERYIKETLHSLLSQSVADWECVIIDDGSTDSTGSVVKQFVGADSRFKYYFQENKGLSGARNSGILYSSGEYLVFLDSDDLLSADMLGLTSGYLDKNSGIAIVSGAWDFINEEGTTISKRKRPVISKDIKKDLLFGNLFPVHTAMVRKNLFSEIGQFDETLKSHEDWDLWIRAAFAGYRFDTINNVVAHYRVHPGCMSLNYERMLSSSCQVLEKNFHAGNIGGYITCKPYVFIQLLLGSANTFTERGNPNRGEELVHKAETIFSKYSINEKFYPKCIHLLTGLPGSNDLLDKMMNSGKQVDKLRYKSLYYIKNAEISLKNKNLLLILKNVVYSLVIWPPGLLIYLKVKKI
jgi:glycosyltransferase involved in cell wall biosynthesis